MFLSGACSLPVINVSVFITVYLGHHGAALENPSFPLDSLIYPGFGSRSVRAYIWFFVASCTQQSLGKSAKSCFIVLRVWRLQWQSPLPCGAICSCRSWSRTTSVELHRQLGWRLPRLKPSRCTSSAVQLCCSRIGQCSILDQVSHSACCLGKFFFQVLVPMGTSKR